MEIETRGQTFILPQHVTNYHVFQLDGYLEVYNPYRSYLFICGIAIIY